MTDPDVDVVAGEQSIVAAGFDGVVAGKLDGVRVAVGENNEAIEVGVGDVAALGE